jgi:hypothetical protein
MLPQIIQNKRRSEDLARADELNKIQQGQFNRQHSLAQNQFAFQQSSAKQARQAADRASEVGVGLEAGKTAMSVGSQYGKKTLGDLGTSARNMFGGSGTGVGLGGFVDKLNFGSMAAGGLAGFSVSKMMGKKKPKWQKSLAGAGAGAALGLLSGGFSGGLSGGFAGALGGLF